MSIVRLKTDFGGRSSVVNKAMFYGKVSKTAAPPATERTNSIPAQLSSSELTLDLDRNGHTTVRGPFREPQ